jgi:DNA-directed RNA polymerase subunit RPC12/RpoP
MKEAELELELICADCGKRFKSFTELLVWHVPEQLVKELRIPQKPHLKCPYCRCNRFTVGVLKDKFGQY